MKHWMSLLTRQAMKLLSEKQRHHFYRKFSSVPDVALDPRITVEIARTREDLTQAFSLLHDCYVGIRILDPQPSGLRCNLFSFLPQTTIIVAKLEGKVIGTVSLIRDSSVGLPSDKQFLSENNSHRANGKTLIEVSALAVAERFRSGNHGVSLLLMKYLYHFSRANSNGDYLIAVVHPKAEDFYKALWHFKRQGPVIQYDSLKKALGIHLSMDLSESHFQKIVQSFGTKDCRKNLALFVNEEDPRFHYPAVETGKVIHPVITPDLLIHFCLEKKEIWNRLAAEDQNSLIQIYSTFFGPDSVAVLKSGRMMVSAHKEFRTPLKLKSIFKVESRSLITDVLDLSAGGCFILCKETSIPEGTPVQVSFQLEGQTYKVEGRVAWQNNSQALYQNQGFGIRFLKPMPRLNSQLQEWLYEPQSQFPSQALQA